jgi:hypothetical protein
MGVKSKVSGTFDILRNHVTKRKPLGIHTRWVTVRFLQELPFDRVVMAFNDEIPVSNRAHYLGVRDGSRYAVGGSVEPVALERLLERDKFKNGVGLLGNRLVRCRRIKIFLP